jgi:hypothetical protein
MRRRNESAVYFEQQLDLWKRLPWLRKRGSKLFPLPLHALSFGAKKAMSDDAPPTTMERRFARGETFATVAVRCS